ncbi:MAG: hypothetical protein WD715_16160, partial [Dongiaceae bacterium]
MTPSRLLILNAGSSSVKFAVYETGARDPALIARGQIAGIGRDATFSVAASSVSGTASPPTLSLPLTPRSAAAAKGSSLSPPRARR